MIKLIGLAFLAIVSLQHTKVILPSAPAPAPIIQMPEPKIVYFKVPGGSGQFPGQFGQF